MYSVMSNTAENEAANITTMSTVIMSKRGVGATLEIVTIDTKSARLLAAKQTTTITMTMKTTSTTAAAEATTITTTTPAITLKESSSRNIFRGRLKNNLHRISKCSSSHLQTKQRMFSNILSKDIPSYIILQFVVLQSIINESHRSRNLQR